jgi:hypothetical protein
MEGAEMVQPINYGIQAPSAFESLVSGLKLGTSLQQIQLQREQQMAAMQQAQEKAEAERQRQARLQMLRGKSFSQWTPDDVLSASDLLPKESLTFLKGQMDQMSTEERRARALTLGQLGSVALMGDAERTSAAFDERIEAETNPREKEALRAQKQIALTRPEDLAKMYAVMLPAMGDEGKQVADNLIKVRAMEPRAGAAARIQGADAIIKEAEAKFAPQKFGLEINLTESQIEQAKGARLASDAAARASGEEKRLKQAQADQLAAGVIPAEKRPEAERNFRNEYNDRTKVYQDVKASYGRVLSSDDSAVGDLSLIFGYMKMLDPGSVVREGEFATAQNAAGVPERVMNIYNRIVSGERLNSDQRKAFKGQAERLFKQASQQESEVRSGIERIAKGYGLNAANIFYTPTEEPPTAPATEVSGAVAQPPAPTRPAATTQPIQPSAPTQRSVDDLLNQYRSR